MRRMFLKAGSAAAMALMWPSLRGQDRYPSKPVRFIVPASAGGPTDVVARIIGEKLGSALHQPVLVDNRPGASLTLGTAAVAQAQPDGYTLLFTTSTPIVMVPFTLRKPPYDVQRDLTTISHLGTTPLVVYVNAASPIHNVKQLIEAAKAKPDAATFGSYGTGSSAHVLGEMLNRQAGLKMVHAPYKGVAPEMQDLAAGLLMMATGDIGTASPLVKAGRIRPIAVTGSQRSSVLPDVATFAEQGITGMEPFSPWWGVFAPVQTPRPILDLLSTEIGKIVRSPDVHARLIGFGVDPTGTTAAQAQDITRADMAKWQAILKELPYINFE